MGRPSKPSSSTRPKKPVSLAQLKSEFSQVQGTSEPVQFSGFRCEGIGLDRSGYPLKNLKESFYGIFIA